MMILHTFIKSSQTHDDDPSAYPFNNDKVPYYFLFIHGIAYTLQVIGQRGINPTIATLILSLESVMAVVFGMLFLNESLTNKELIGCILMFIAVIIAQLPTRKQNTLS